MAAVTIEDVAKRAGCTPGTVSRALNGRKGIKKETRERISEIAESMGYTPNVIAQSLVSRQTHAIGLLMPDISLNVLTSIAMAADEFLFEHNYNLILCNTGFDVEKERSKLQFLYQRKVDGILIRPCGNDLSTVCELGIPAVVVSHMYRGPLSYVDIENENAGYMATKHLLDCGYRRVAFVGSEDFPHELRLQGYIRAHQERGLEVRPDFIRHVGFRIEDGVQAMNDLCTLTLPPDGAFCCCDRVALGLFKRAQELRIRVPDEFGIVGFDDDEVDGWPQFSLTSIHQPAQEIGRLAAKILLEQIEADEPVIPQKLQLYPQLIERGTTRKKHL